MNEQIEASPETIIELTKQISFCIKEIARQNQDLSDHLTKLGETFRDDGYEIVRSCVDKMQKGLEDAVPDICEVTKSLVEYAWILRNGT